MKFRLPNFSSRAAVPPSKEEEEEEEEVMVVDWSEFHATVPLSRIKKMVFSPDLSLARVELYRSSEVHVVSVHEYVRSWLFTELLKNKVPYHILPTTGTPFPFSTICSFFFSFSSMLLWAFLMYMNLQRSRSPASVSQFTVSRPRGSPVWLGSSEVLRECMETVQGPDPFRGLLLEGSPGTGKTLLARKIAAEVNASFIPVVGSQFVEVYVGLGAQRIRQLFHTARQHTPVIVFFDEMDAIGMRRGSSYVSENDNTLNQLLAEMDGFERSQGIFVLAATNRVDSMDPALLRPGRFDRVVHIPLPDTPTRQDMLVHFLREAPLSIAPEVVPRELETLAILSEGFSGAVLQRVVREASIFARRENHTCVQLRHLDLAMEKEWVGLLKVQDDRSPQEITRVAVHECGHALLAHRFFRVRKVSIRPNHKGMGGFTLYDHSMALDPSPSRSQLQHTIIVLLGGRAAEMLYYGPMETSVGAVQDLASANEIAEAMILHFGYSDRFHALASSRSLAWSDAMQHALHDEIQSILEEAWESAVKLLNESWNVMTDLVPRVVAVQSMNESAFHSVLQQHVS